MNYWNLTLKMNTFVLLSVSIFSFFLFFFCPDVKCAGTGTNVLMSPEQGVFGYGSIDLLAGDEDEDVFSP